jgi:hypothetical protein
MLSVCSLSVNADSTNPFMAISTPLAFTPGTQFPIPITNGSISFAQIGYYENASLVNDTWVFTHLQLDSQQTNLLSDSPTTANLNITTQDSNITITNFDRLLTPDGGDINNTGSWLTAGWLNYSVTGVGKQIISVQFNLANWTSPSPSNFANGTLFSTWPIIAYVYIDGKEAVWGNGNSIIPYSAGGNAIIPYGTGAIVNGANSSVSIEYAWAPVPANQSTGSSLPTTKTSTESSSAPYILIVVVASAILVPVAVFSNRHRLESIINKRIKHKHYTA